MHMGSGPGILSCCLWCLSTSAACAVYHSVILHSIQAAIAALTSRDSCISRYRELLMWTPCVCREPSFGHGILQLLSPSEATWTW